MTGTPASFVPPHCPGKNCPHQTSATGWRWKRFGFFRQPLGGLRIQRYRCVHCGVTFSTQTFETTYRLRRPELLVPIAERMNTCAGFRQMAREARCSPSTLVNMATRIGRQALLFLSAHRPKEALREPLVIDGFESFAHSQYQPLYLNIGVGAESHYTYAFTISPMRRKGRMTAAQRKKRGKLESLFGRPDPKAIEKGTAQMLAIAAPMPQALVVRSDEHQAYPRAFRRVPHLDITHEMTPSVAARTTRNPLFPVNLMDLLFRHSGSNHKRETIAFSKRHQAVVERAAWLICWRNFCKPFSEQHGGGTPAMRAGIAETQLSVRQIFRTRLFAERVDLPGPWKDYYNRLLDTPGIKNPRRISPTLAI
jgi:transposase-like protein